jgi:beta-glucosidase
MNFEQFPSDFIWGTAISAAQTEGMPQADGAGLSIWDEFSLRKGKIKNKHHAQIGCNFYTHYKSDLAMVKKLEIPNFRFSIAWPRIYPNGYGHVNHPGLDFYKRLVDTCLEQGIRPWATLYHWDLPAAIEAQGGWTNRSIVGWFKEYVLTIAMHLGDRVKDWFVLNEPMAFTGAGYFLGLHAPGKMGMGNFIPAMHHAALCQAEGARILRSEFSNANIGTTFSMSQVQPASENPSDLQAADKVHALLNRLFLEASLGYGYPTKELPFLEKVEKYFRPGDEKRMEFDFDFIGIQNYTREIVTSNWYTPYLGAKMIPAKDRKVPLTAMDWEIYPPALYNVLKFAASYEKVKSIIVSENGAAFLEPQPHNGLADMARIEFIKQNIYQLKKAISESDKIKGYFIWSLLDNFEWAEGFDPRFGLIHVDFETQKRTIKHSGYWYRKFILEQLSNMPLKSAI